MEVLFETDPLTRSVTRFHYDDETDAVTLHTQVDVQPILDANKRASNDETMRPRAGNTFRRVASVPLDLLFAWRKEWRDRGMTWEERQADLAKRLNDSDLRYLRTDGGSRL